MRLFAKNKIQTFSIDNSTIHCGKFNGKINNSIVAGNQCEGRVSILSQMIGDAFNNDIFVILIQNGSTTVGNPLLSALNEYFNPSIFSYDLVNHKYDLGVDFFSHLPDQEKINVLMKLMKIVSKPNDDVIQYTKLYLMNLIDVIGRLDAGICIPINAVNLKKYSVTWMRNRIKGLQRVGKIDSSSHERLKYFVDTFAPIHLSQEMELGYFLTELHNYDFDDSISNGKSLTDIMDSNDMINIRLDQGIQKNISDAFVSIFLDEVVKVISKDRSHRVLIIAEDVDVLRSQEFYQLMSTCQTTSSCNFIFTTSNLVKDQKSDEAWNPVGLANTFYIFKQNDPENREFWAKLSGTHKELETTRTKTTNRSAGNTSRGTVSDVFFGKKLTYNGETETMVEKYNIKENDLIALNDDSCMFLSIGTNGEPYYMTLNL